ncbi:hypothetical protein PI124_g25 [Phytophthora idaei]|nr:hypothetical protein PI124_g25 [Phytophthora idaei]
MQVPVVQQSVRLTHVEEQLFLRCKIAYKVDFEELEGFTVLRGNLERLLGKDTAVASRIVRVRERTGSTTCNVRPAARKLAKSASAALEKRTNELRAFHVAEVKMREKQWTVQADKRLQDHMQVLSD